MIISVDIDGVLVDREKYQLDKAMKYAKKNNLNYLIKDEKAYNVDGIFGWEKEEFIEFWNKYLFDYAKKAPIKDVRKILNKLKHDNHKIIINTSRWLTEKDDELGQKMKEIVKKWFKKHKIPYDELVFACGDKLKVIKEYNANIHIEDNPKEAEPIAENIPVIIYKAKYNDDYNDSNIYKVSNWKEIYSVIKQFEGKNIWGKECECGNNVFAFFDEHPWKEEVISKNLVCSKCKKNISINNEEASEYYNNLIFKCYDEVKGNVLEIGCGGGLLTSYLANKKEVNQVVAIDNDLSKDEEEYINSLNVNKFIKLDLDNFDENIFNMHFDYVICRDVLMYLDNIDYTFKKLSKISDKIILLNWHNPNHKNCINKTKPKDIFKIMKKYYKNIEISYPFFYKYGYLIKTTSLDEK